GELEQYRVVGAVDIIKGDDLIRSTEYNVESALAGLAPGLSIFKGQQSPGIDQTFMRIRGNSRGGQSEFPLVVIDGIANRSLSSITLEEIESIQVLKDVTAKMLYGSRAANGVLMVTTKRGYDGPKKVTISGEYGVKTPTRLPEYVNSAQYAQLYNQARINDGLDPLYTPSDIEGYQSPSILFPDVDFYDEFLEPNTNFQRINAQLIGGSNNTQYFLNVGYVGENGLEKVGRQQQFNRINVRSNLDYNVNNVVSMFLDIAGRIDIWNRPDDNQGLFGALSTHRPNDYPLYVSQTPDLDSLGWSPRLGTNLVGELARSGYRNTTNSYAQTNIGLDFDFDKYIKGLSASTYLTFDFYNAISIGKSLDYSRIDPSDFTRIGTDVLKSSEARMGDDFLLNLGLVSSIDYDNSWNNHDLSVNLVSVTQTLSRKATLSGPTTQQDDKNVNIGLRANYVLSKKYVVEASSSYMGSDKFAPENRWGLFGAGGLGWIISQEDFLKNSSAINYLKLKLDAPVFR
ncbi:MAG: TonB-dependent receptor plug domain-containing protein, partial [Bacteroidota bacterium]